MNNEVPMNTDTLKNIADQLNTARTQCAPVEQFSGTHKDMTRADAYTVQELGVEYRQSQGENIVGLKMGLTSEAKRKQMDLDSPLYGVLTDKMRLQSGGEYSLKGQIHPRLNQKLLFLSPKNSIKIAAMKMCCLPLTVFTLP